MKHVILITIAGFLFSFLAFGNQLSASTTANSVRIFRLHRRKSFAMAAAKISRSASKLSVASRKKVSDARWFIAARNLCNRMAAVLDAPVTVAILESRDRILNSLASLPPPLPPPIA